MRNAQAAYDRGIAMTFRFDGIIAFVSDIGAAARTYAEALGLEQDWADDQHVQFHLPTKGDPKGAWLLLHPATETSGPQYLGYFGVDDVDATTARLRAAGFAVTEEPNDAPWGVRIASVTDPDGNGMTLTAPLADH
jgi:predicted enzyme related to lactoylglutathione lyase